MVVPLPAGAAVDVIGRLVAAKLGERLGQTVVIENRAGASGAIGADAVAKAAPDGYTLGMATTTTHVTNAIVNSKLAYDPVKDFTPIALIGVVPYALSVSPKLPVNNVRELIALAKSKPGMLNYSSVGLGSVAHLATELLSNMTGIKLNHVPYRSASQAVIDLAEGRIDITFGTLGSSLPLIKDGKIKLLAVSTTRRASQVPDIPTIAEAGVPGFETSLWFALVAPAKLPRRSPRGSTRSSTRSSSIPRSEGVRRAGDAVGAYDAAGHGRPHPHRPHALAGDRRQGGREAGVDAACVRSSHRRR